MSDDELSPQARQVIQIACEFERMPSVEDRSRVRAAVMASVTGLSVVSAGPAEAAGLVGTAAAANGGIAAGAAAAASGGAAAGGAAAGGATLAAAAKTGLVGSLTAKVAAWAAGGVAATAVVAAPFVLSDSKSEAPQAPPIELVVETAPEVAAVEEPAQVEVTEEVAADPETPPKAKVSRAVAPSEPKPQAAAAIADEVRELAQAQNALREGRAEEALRSLRAEENKSGALATERLAAEVFALCQLGRTSEAKARAQQFLKQAPKSPLAARVQSSCAFNSATNDSAAKAKKSDR
jgi:type IV secretory pathway VirB10-like protein